MLLLLLFVRVNILLGRVVQKQVEGLALEGLDLAQARHPLPNEAVVAIVPTLAAVPLRILSFPVGRIEEGASPAVLHLAVEDDVFLGQVEAPLLPLKLQIHHPTLLRIDHVDNRAIRPVGDQFAISTQMVLGPILN